MTELRDSYPQYFISKNRIEVSDSAMVEKILSGVTELYKEYSPLTIDGIKVDFQDKRSWFQLRKSNTEPIIRLYTEAPTEEEADALAKSVIAAVDEIIK